MNAISVYVNTAKLVLQTTEATTAAAANLNPELSRLLLSLRQLLSCVVCNRLVSDPYTPHNGQCNHNVCRLCVRGPKILHPACNHCKDNKDFKTYNENKQMRCLLLCYKSLCEHLRCSSVFGHFAGLKVGQYNSSPVPSVIVPQMSLQDLIVEGASYDDILNAFNTDLPKHFIMPLGKHSQIPALVTPFTSIAAATPLAPIQHTIKVPGMQQSAPKASTPPGCVSSAVSIPVSSYAPKLKVENSSSHHQYKHHTSVTTSTASLPITASSQDHPTPLNTAVTHAQMIQLNQLKNSGNFTYIGPNTRGIVVPIVSSSGSTAVPLSIASARLQTLNRQLAQARAMAVSSTNTAGTTSVNTSSNSMEPRNTLATFKGSISASQTIKSAAAFSSSPTTTTSCVTATSSQLRNPPPIKTVSNGSAMYSVLYTGIGNKITIKRKTDGDEDTTQKKNSSLSTSSTNLLRPVSKTQNKKRGCRCGNTTATPGKLTCCGQRCPCYVDSKSCIGCKCRGCRNPHRPDGNKVRPIIPELACYEIQMADDLGNVNELPIATTSNALHTLSNENTAITNLPTTLNYNATTSTLAAAAVTSTNSTNTTLVPLRGLHHFSIPSVSSSSCITTSTIPPLTSTTMSTKTPCMTQASFGSTSASSTPVTVATSISSNMTAPGNIVQLDQIQRESLLIQNAEGKFQVVNLFTTGTGGSSSCTGQSSNQIPTLQRIKTMPQTVVSAHNSFILPSSINSASMSGTTTTTSLPQFILQSQQQQQHAPGQHIMQSNQQQQQQHHLNHHSISAQRIPNNVTATSLPLQLQQQLKQNIITVHAIHTNPTSNTSPVTAPVLTPSSSPAPTSATLSLPPLITHNPHTSLDITDSSEVSRNAFTNIIVSSSSENISTSSSSITSIPLTVSLAGTVHTQSLNRKSINSPNF